MPYFIYSIQPDKTVNFLQDHSSFKEAKKQVTELRVNRQPGDEATYRMVFAEDKQQARRLVTTKREMSSPLEEWEEKL